MMDMTFNNLTAGACADSVPSAMCTAKRATLLLGPLYGTDDHTHARFAPILDAGVKDAWRKNPGQPPYYTNAARHLTLESPPAGWDPNGPFEQVLPDFRPSASYADYLKDEV